MQQGDRVTPGRGQTGWDPCVRLWGDRALWWGQSRGAPVIWEEPEAATWNPPVSHSEGWLRDFRVLSFLGTGVLLEVWVEAHLGLGTGCRVPSVPLHP